MYSLQFSLPLSPHSFPPPLLQLACSPSSSPLCSFSYYYSPVMVIPILLCLLFFLFLLIMPLLSSSSMFDLITIIITIILIHHSSPAAPHPNSISARRTLQALLQRSHMHALGCRLQTGFLVKRRRAWREESAFWLRASAPGAAAADARGSHGAWDGGRARRIFPGRIRDKRLRE